jgi:hypothetical protein
VVLGIVMLIPVDFSFLAFVLGGFADRRRLDRDAARTGGEVRAGAWGERLGNSIASQTRRTDGCRDQNH